MNALKADQRSGEKIWSCEEPRASLLSEPGDLVAGDGAEVLVVDLLDRLSRCLLDFASLMERARRRGWGLVALDWGKYDPARRLMSVR